MKLQQMNGKQYFITLPCQIVRAKGWVKGDTIKVLIDAKGELVVKRVEEKYINKDASDNL